MVTPFRSLSALLLLLGVSACLSSPDDPGGETVEQRRWQSQRIDDYSVQFRLVCFCVLETTEPVVLQVRDGALVSVTRVADGRAVDRSEWAGRYYTVDEMFAVIAEARSKGAFDVRVSYDERLGYPTEVYLDPSARVADDERHFQIGGLAPAR